MEQSNQSKRVLLSVIGVAILVVAVVGVSFAFFNYTRTGNEQTIATGSIYFVSSQNGNVSLTNFFPTDTSNTNSTNSTSMTISISGGTTYANGIDYTLTAVNIQRAATVANIPVTVTTALNDGADTGVTFTGVTAQEIPANASTMPLGSGNIAKQTNGGQLDGANRVVSNGVITVTAFIPSSVAITDTYNESSSWVNGRQYVTTSQWNSLAETPVTFSVRVEAYEGATAPANGG